MLSSRIPHFIRHVVGSNCLTRISKSSPTICSSSSRCLSSQEPYRNRYTHHRKAYPGGSNYVYGIYVCSIVGLLFFFSFGGGIYMDNMELAYIDGRKKKKELVTKVECQEVSVPDDEDDVLVKKKRAGFRERKFIAYEDRIRAFSTPDKIFRYFATLKCAEEDGEAIYMTPDDFLRAITPGMKQPDGLELDAFMRYDPKVRSVIMDTTAMGRRHRDHGTTGSTLRKRSNSALQHYFFGPEADQKLKIEKFLQFHSLLQEEITRLEFNRASPVDDKITETQFANFLLTYAGFSEQKRRKLMRGVKQKFAKSEDNEGISYKDFSDFNAFLRSIADVDTALTFHHMAGAAIDQATLQHVAHTVANIQLSPHVIDVVYTLFDENNDGQLSYREFVGVMRHRLLRGLDKSMDTGFVRFINALFSCAKEQLHYVPGVVN